MTTMTDMQQPDYKKHRQEMELTPEETRMWHECMKSSSSLVPTIMGAVAGYGLLRLTPFHGQAKYAAIFGATIGLISGRLMATEKCLKKITSMPNSNLKERLIEAGFYGNVRPTRDGRRYQDSQPLEVQPEIQNTEEIVFDDYPQMTAHDAYSSISDSGDFQTTENTELTEPINLQKGVSYDELRNKNREEFYKKNKQWYAPRVADKRPASNTTERIPTTSNTSPIEEKNKYGDVWG